MYRVLFASYRRKGLTRQQFLAHYLSVHVAIARRFPGLRVYQIPKGGRHLGADMLADQHLRPRVETEQLDRTTHLRRQDMV